MQPILVLNQGLSLDHAPIGFHVDTHAAFELTHSNSPPSNSRLTRFFHCWWRMDGELEGAEDVFPTW
ncbi:hypothetical protein PC116_g28681 [Phytophthora cactorum]|nr:hypothetical protein PC116_g28681 [Phytophthora cactorum]